MDNRDVDLTEMDYYSIAVFFVNNKVVYEEIGDAIQIYTSQHPGSLAEDSDPIFLKDSEWLVYKSIEVYTTNVVDTDIISKIIDMYPNSKIKRGFISE